MTRPDSPLQWPCPLEDDPVAALEILLDRGLAGQVGGAFVSNDARVNVPIPPRQPRLNICLSIAARDTRRSLMCRLVLLQLILPRVTDLGSSEHS